MNCPDDPTLDYTGLITTVDDLRHLAGLPSEDPADAAYIPDTELTTIIDRYKAILDDLAKQRSDKQCQEYTAARDSAQATANGLMEKILMTGQIPNGAQEYADEVAINLLPSPSSIKTGDSKAIISYGIIEEPYVAYPFALTVIDTDDTRHAATRDPEFEKIALTSPFEKWRYDTRGRRVYVTNNSRDVPTAYLWLVTDARLKDFVYSQTPQYEAIHNFVFITDDALVSDVVPNLNAQMIAEVSSAVGRETQVGTRIELQKDA